MTDIVERLRESPYGLSHEAADTIEGLRGTMADMHGDIARLRTIVDLANEKLGQAIETLKRVEP